MLKTSGPRPSATYLQAINETSTAFPAAPLNPPDYVFTGDGEVEHLTVFRLGADPISIGSTHPLFDEIRDGVKDKRLSIEDIMSMVDMSAAAPQNFGRISDRVTVSDGRLYFDGDEVQSTLADPHRPLHRGQSPDWGPLVAFMEKLALNPTEHSRAQFYDWLSRREFTITADGDFIAYKGVDDDEDDNYVSINRRPGDRQRRGGQRPVPNPLGAIVELARSQVNFNPTSGCSTGLHVGSYEYAHWFANGALLKVKVNPRDVVSVPTDCDWQKMRVCRYEVLETIDAPETKSRSTTATARTLMTSTTATAVTS